MRVRYMSDLHLELTDYQPSFIPSVGEDLVILAGDIGVGVDGFKWARNAFKGRSVLYILGNHEFYGNNFNDLPAKLRAAAEGSNVHVLEEESIVISGIRFLGATLWTDFKLFGPERRSLCMQLASQMNDYNQIMVGPLAASYPITPAETMARNRSSRIWLDREISKSVEPCVVVTHHGPSFKTCEPENRGDFLTAAFLSDAEHLLRAPVKAWIFGHTHQVLQLEINAVPLLTNQRGYQTDEVPGFNWDIWVEIDA